MKNVPRCFDVHDSITLQRELKTILTATKKGTTHQSMFKENLTKSNKDKKKMGRTDIQAGEGGRRVRVESLWEEGRGEALCVCVSEQKHCDGCYLHLRFSLCLLLLASLLAPTTARVLPSEQCSWISLKIWELPFFPFKSKIKNTKLYIWSFKLFYFFNLILIKKFNNNVSYVFNVDHRWLFR